MSKYVKIRKSNSKGNNNCIIKIKECSENICYKMDDDSNIENKINI